MMEELQYFLSYKLVLIKKVFLIENKKFNINKNEEEMPNNIKDKLLNEKLYIVNSKI